MSFSSPLVFVLVLWLRAACAIDSPTCGATSGTDCIREGASRAVNLLQGRQRLHTSQKQNEEPGLWNGNIHHSTLVNNNLGDMGPSTGQAPTIVLSNVGTLKNGKSVTLTISNLTEYLPRDAEAAGQNGRGGDGASPFGLLNMKCNTETKLRFAFSDDSGAPVTLGELHLYFLDLDSDTTEKVKEFVDVLTDFEHSEVSAETELNETALSGGGVRWMSSKAGDGDDNPTDPNALTLQQRARTVSLRFKDVSQIDTVFGSTKEGACSGGRNLMFDLWLPPTLVCTIANSTLSNNNLGNAGPTSGDPTIVLDNFGTYNGDTVRLVITNLTEYVPANANAAARNGVNGKLGVLNVKTGTKTKLSFEFYTNEELMPLSRLPFAFLDLDSNVQSTADELLGVYDSTPYFSKTLAFHTELETSSASGVEYFRSSTPGDGDDNPTDPMELDEKQRQRSVQFDFRDTSRLDVSFGSEGQGDGGRNVMFACCTNLLECC